MEPILEPRDSAVLNRRSLIGRLRSSTHSMIVISGPAGAGKTTLVRTWAREEPQVRLLSISRHHNTAASLLNAVVEAVGGAPHQGDPDNMPVWLDQLARALAAAAFTPEQPCRLVLDGVEAVSDAQARQLLRDLVENVPPALQLIVTTRQRSPDWISRSRACGFVMSIKADELRLGPSEVQSLLGDNVHEDVQRFDGWALGVGLVAAVGGAEAEEAIRDFLRSEVMGRVTTEVRHLLYAVSIAGEVGPALAIHLTDNSAAGEVLARFAATTQFATVTEGPVFKLHPVLVKYLTDELATEQWESYAALRRRHADWLARQDRLDESIRLYIELGSGAEARAALLTHWQRCVLSGDAQIVRCALGHLPPEQLAADPRLCMVMAMVNIASGDMFEGQRWIDVAEAHEDMDMEPGLPVGVAIEVARRFVLALTTGSMPDGAVDHPLHGLWSAIFELSHGLCSVWSGEYAIAAARLRRAEVAARVSGDHLALVHALAGLALAQALDGDSHAIESAEEALTMAGRLSPGCGWTTANAFLALAVVHLSAGSKYRARAAANQALTSLRGVSGHLEQQTRVRALAILGTAEEEDERDTSARRQVLSSRERRVLTALSGPLTLREIADELCVSRNTVKSQVSSIFRKLGVHDRTAAVAAARSWTSDQQERGAHAVSVRHRPAGGRTRPE
ncbi:LuxR C-terminal-related transcriptional regulator [Streptomyces sp. NPDC050788]|jgi:LuxR family maltose regulon positive regulatory protein|uniref:LuxR C-terminal-related transcriptional regulator n=1 Tax=Streptomyces sp. NPDC050788 TaxID=3155041 RepID=UPI0034206724